MIETAHTRIAISLNRLVKLAMDTGEAQTLEDAHRLFRGYCLAVSVGNDVGHSRTHQAALLTIVNSARRCLLGGIEVIGVTGMDLLVPVPGYRSLEDAVVGLGGQVVESVSPEAPLVIIGNGEATNRPHFAIRTTFDGWAGGILPLRRDEMRLGEHQEFTPAGVVAGALAVAEAFQFLRKSQPAAGLRDVGLSLWRPELPWQDGAAIGPVIDRLPASLWLVGLGNLGQAYLWTLGMLPYSTAEEVHLVLQDFDTLALSNDSTSLLTSASLVGVRKTRAMADWAEQRGFKTAIVERRFNSDIRVDKDEPAFAVCGVDNELARSALEEVGFDKVIEAGLGGGTHDFLGFRTHVFPGACKARDLWWNSANDKRETRIDLPAYKELATSGLDQCGLTQLAGRTVGAPFVGATAAAIVIGEAIRTVIGAHSYDLIDGHLRDLRHLTVADAADGIAVNLGATAIRPN